MQNLIWIFIAHHFQAVFLEGGKSYSIIRSNKFPTLLYCKSDLSLLLGELQ